VQIKGGLSESGFSGLGDYQDGESPPKSGKEVPVDPEAFLNHFVAIVLVVHLAGSTSCLSG
jgi:hypothetical protein